MRAEQPTSGGPLTSCYERFGCEVNRLSVRDLFRRYMDSGFLYADKLRRIGPFTAEILDNWQRAASSPDGLLRVVTYTGAHQRSWASLATWRHTETGWCTQHLVSRGDPLASRAVMLSEQEATLDEPRHLSNQNWFQPSNRLPRRIFAPVIGQLGPEAACANLLTVFDVPRVSAPRSAGISISELDGVTQPELFELAAASRGRVYATAEGFADEDFALAGIDRLYRRVGLFRHRRAFLAREGGELVAALVAYRGPLGLNYSFIENRAELLVAASASARSIASATRALIDAASDTYAGFSPGYIPLFVDQVSAPALACAGFQPIRTYYQTLWLRSGYARYQAHLLATFARVVERAERHRRRREAREPSSTLEST